jgi:hypothetical protein
LAKLWPFGHGEQNKLRKLEKNVEEMCKSVKGGGSSIIAIGTLAHLLALLALYATHLIEGKSVEE